jgi:hypothetical protein
LQWEGLSLPVRLRNISSGGALLESERGLAPGAHVQLDLPGCGIFDAEVRWSQSGRLGVRFDGEFDLKKLAPPKRRGSNVKVLRPEYLETGAAPGQRGAALLILSFCTWLRKKDYLPVRYGIKTVRPFALCLETRWCSSMIIQR